MQIRKSLTAKHMSAIFFSIAVVLNCSLLSAEEPRADPCDKVVLPKALERLLLEKFPTWRALRLSDLTPEHQQFWLQSEGKKNCPGIAIGYFETKEAKAYAFSLIPRDPKGHGHRIIVISQNTRGRYQSRVVDRWNGPGTSELVIYPVPPGKYSDIYEEVSVQLTLEGLQMEEMEKGAVMFCWKNGQYQRLQISD